MWSKLKFAIIEHVLETIIYFILVLYYLGEVEFYIYNL